MDIFHFRDNKVEPTEHALLVPPFKKVWDRDKSKDKTRAIAELTYIVFMLDPRRKNPYSGKVDKKEKHEVLSVLLFEDATWEPDPVVEAAYHWYRSYIKELVPSLALYEMAVLALRSTTKSLSDAIAGKEDGTPGMPPEKVLSVMKQLKESTKSLEDYRTAVEEEIFSNVQGKAGKQINPFERRPAYK